MQTESWEEHANRDLCSVCWPKLQYANWRKDGKSYCDKHFSESNLNDCPAGKYCDNDICDYREQHRKAVTSRNNPMQTESKPKWELQFREYFDKTLKPKKPTMGNLDRELCINFLRQTIAEVIDEIPSTVSTIAQGGYIFRIDYIKQQLRDKYL